MATFPEYDKHYNYLSRLEKQVDAAFEQEIAYFTDPQNNSRGDFEKYAQEIRNYDLGSMENNTTLQHLRKRKMDKVSTYERKIRELQFKREKGIPY